MSSLDRPRAIQTLRPQGCSCLSPGPAVSSWCPAGVQRDPGIGTLGSTNQALACPPLSVWTLRPSSDCSGRAPFPGPQVASAGAGFCLVCSRVCVSCALVLLTQDVYRRKSELGHSEFLWEEVTGETLALPSKT